MSKNLKFSKNLLVYIDKNVNNKYINRYSILVIDKNLGKLDVIGSYELNKVYVNKNKLSYWMLKGAILSKKLKKILIIN